MSDIEKIIKKDYVNLYLISLDSELCSLAELDLFKSIVYIL